MITPIKRRAKCLMAEERCTSTIPKQPKPMIEERRCFPNSVGIDAASREFNSKRYSVEPSANFADKCGVGIAMRAPEAA